MRYSELKRSKNTIIPRSTTMKESVRLDSLFPLIGEVLLQAIIEENPADLLAKFGIGVNTPISVLNQGTLAFSNDRVRFDGVQRLDLGLLIDSKEVVGIEVKLGMTGLNKAKINSWLTECSISSHSSGMRLSGNMLAVLSRSYDKRLLQEIESATLLVNIGSGQFVPLSTKWGLVVREKYVRSWQKDPPNFTTNVELLSLERDILKPYGRTRFNELCRRLLCREDYYSDWIGD